MQAIKTILGVNFSDIKLGTASICGEHGEFMVPMFSNVTVNDVPLNKIITPEQKLAIKNYSINKGVNMMNGLGKKSPFIAAIQAIFNLITCFYDGEEHALPCCAWNPDYEVYMTTPVCIKNGVWKNLSFSCDKAEIAQIRKAVVHIKQLKQKIDDNDYN